MMTLVIEHDNGKAGQRGFTDPENPDKFQIVSPSTKEYKYQITAFDSLGPVYDIQKDDPGMAAEEINERYVLESVI